MVVCRGDGQALAKNRSSILFAKRKIISYKLMQFWMIAGPTQATHLVDRDIHEWIESNFPHFVLTFHVTSVFMVAMPKMEHGFNDTFQGALAVAVSSFSPFLIMTIHG